MLRCAAYLRYSSDRQKAESTADQLALLSRLAEQRGWQIGQTYADPAISGAHTDRPGLRKLLADADSGLIDVLLVEDLTRLSRDLGDLDGLVKRLTFARVRVVGANGFDSASEWSRLQLGLEGIMGEAYLRELGSRTHRGQRGAVERGGSAGGRAYGYRSEPVMGDDGKVHGWRKIVDEREAAIVRRIFLLAADGESPYQIVRRLNEDRIPGPRGGTWARSAVYADKRANVGILANPVYVGESIWNRSHWERIPGTRRRRRVERPESDWQRRTDPALAIVDRETWDRAQDAIRRTQGRPGRRGVWLLSGLLRCANCGATYTQVNADRLGCSAHANRGPSVCPQSMTVRRSVAEREILDHVRRELLTDEARDYFARELERILSQRRDNTAPLKRRIADAELRRRNLVRAIEEGLLTESTRIALLQAEADLAEAKAELAAAEQPEALTIDGRMFHRRMVAALHDITDKGAARMALGELLGEVRIAQSATGPVARIDRGHALARLAVGNSGSGGAIRPFSIPVEIKLG